MKLVTYLVYILIKKGINWFCDGYGNKTGQNKILWYRKHFPNLFSFYSQNHQKFMHAVLLGVKILMKHQSAGAFDNRVLWSFCSAFQQLMREILWREFSNKSCFGSLESFGDWWLNEKVEKIIKFVFDSRNAAVKF